MTEPPTIPDDISAMTFEAALAELERIVASLEAGDIELEKSITIYSRGIALKAHCEAKLKSAQEKIDKIVIGADGTVGAEPAAFK